MTKAERAVLRAARKALRKVGVPVFFQPTLSHGIKHGDLVTFGKGIMAPHATAHIAVAGKDGAVQLRYIGRAKLPNIERRSPRKTSRKSRAIS